MRVLFVSNYYPPHSRGGYELWCQEVADELTWRGHQVTILTSRVPLKIASVSDENGVTIHRTLHLEVEAGLTETIIRLLINRKQLERDNTNYVQSLIHQFQPDVALIWGMWNVPRSVPALIETLLHDRVAYYLCDYWPSLPNAYTQRLQVSARRSIAKIPKRILGRIFLQQLEKEKPVDLKLQYPICVSQAVRKLLVEAAVPVEHAQVIYGGTQVNEFVNASKKRCPRESHTMRLLYVGRLNKEKGIHTIIKALAILAKQKYMSSVTLDIYGSGNPDYENSLRTLVDYHHLKKIITFKGSVPHSEIPTMFANYDSLIFPSEWEEPFARTILEAMASGLVVIGTTTGGTGEILLDGDTGLTFTKGDAKALAAKINQLFIDTNLQQTLANSGQQRVLKYHKFSRMVDQLEITLQRIGTAVT